jgi:hypothetical protein
VLAACIFGLLLGGVTYFQSKASSHGREISARSRAETQARRAVERVLDELCGISSALLVPDPVGALGSATIAFQKPASVSNAGVVAWSAQNRLALVLDDGETDNGLDDDGDGLTDERRLVLTRAVGAPNEVTVTLCHGIAAWYPGELGNGVDDNLNGATDERGFNIQRIGDLLHVRVCVQVPAGPGEIADWTVDTAMRLRN